MREEIEAAATFITRLISKNLSSFTTDKTEQFRQNLTNALYERFHDHWFPEQPTKGQAYRCIRLNESDRHDPILSLTCLQCGINYSDLQLPLELTLWVDPEEVTCRFGEYKGSHCLVAKFRNGQLQEDNVNQIDIDDFEQKTMESIRQASFDLAKPRSSNKSANVQQQHQRRELLHNHNNYHQTQQQAKNQHHSPASMYKQQLQMQAGDINGNLDLTNNLVNSTANMSLNGGVGSPMTNHNNNNSSQTNHQLNGSNSSNTVTNGNNNNNNTTSGSPNRLIENDYQTQSQVDAAVAASAAMMRQQMMMSPFHNTSYMYSSPPMMKYVQLPAQQTSLKHQQQQQTPLKQQQQQASSLYRNSYTGQSPISAANAQLDSSRSTSTPTSSPMIASSTNSNHNFSKYFQQSPAPARALQNIQLNPVMNYFQTYCPYPPPSNDRYHYTKSIVKV